jgi:hypothetical protein
MLTKPYGNTGKEISAVGFGGMRFPRPENIDEMAELVVYAHQRGITYFDTAPFYCQDKSEEIMGAAFAQMQPGTFYASTKCNKPDGGEFRESLERSLKRLGLEKIHFFHVWCVVTLESWKQRVEQGAVAEALKAKEEGLVEHVVVSSHLPSEDLSVLLEEGPFEGITLGYCALNFPYRGEAVEQAGRKGLGVVTMNPLAGGLIPQNAEKFEFLREPHDRSVVEAALRFNVSNPHVTSALVGFSEKAHIDEAVNAMEDFQPYHAEKIDQIRGQILDRFEGLCTGCRYCLPCPQGINIPRMMDAYNMRILQGEDPRHITQRLAYHWAMKPEQAEACSLCGLCEQRCTQHLPIQERLQYIASLKQQPDES